MSLAVGRRPEGRIAWLDPLNPLCAAATIAIAIDNPVVRTELWNLRLSIMFASDPFRAASAFVQSGHRNTEFQRQPQLRRSKSS
jgi:hypothetical protein